MWYFNIISQLSHACGMSGCGVGEYGNQKKHETMLNNDLFFVILQPIFKMHDMKAALFDLDGVVFDTEPQYTLFWGEQCREFHPETPGLEHTIKGQTLTQIYEKYFSGSLECKRELITRRLDEFEQGMSFDYVEGFLTFVYKLKDMGIKTAVVTSSNRAKMESVYQKVPDFSHLFDEILTSEDFAESKPSPDCYLKAAARFDLDAADCVVFEDSFNGIRSGRAAGMKVVGLATTNSRQSILPLCDIVIDDYNQLNISDL